MDYIRLIAKVLPLLSPFDRPARTHNTTRRRKTTQQFIDGDTYIVKSSAILYTVDLLRKNTPRVISRNFNLGGVGIDKCLGV